MLTVFQPNINRKLTYYSPVFSAGLGGQQLIFHPTPNPDRSRQQYSHSPTSGNCRVKQGAKLASPIWQRQRCSNSQAPQFQQSQWATKRLNKVTRSGVVTTILHPLHSHISRAQKQAEPPPPTGISKPEQDCVSRG